MYQKKKSAKDEGRSHKRTSQSRRNKVIEKTIHHPNKKKRATQSHSEKPVKTLSICSARKKNSHEAEGLSFTPHDAKKQEKSDTLETCKGCNTPLVSDSSLDCEPQATCLDRNMVNTGVTKNDCIKEEKTKVETGTRKLEVDNKDIKVNCEKLKLTGKEPKVKEELELNNQNISSEEDQPRTALLEHLQGTSQSRSKAVHFHQGHKFADIKKKEECDNIKHESSPKCVHQVGQEDVANTSQTEDKCKACKNTIKEESKPTKANDGEKRNGSRESKNIKDTDSSQILDIKGNKRPLEAVEECAKKRRKESAVGLGSSEHKNKEEIDDDESLEDGEIKEDSKVEESDGEVEPHKTKETKTPKSIGKESALREVKRYSKVVVVGDARMTLLATSDIKEQLHEVTQVIVVPNLTLSGILEVVQREVVKEVCPRGILLLCLAGVLGTLVECQVPKECRTAGHSDMHEMVPATKGNFLDPEFPKQLASLKRKLQDTLGRGSSVLFFPVLPVDMTNFNEIAAKHHFDATGHKLEHLSQSGSLHYQLLQQYKKAVEEVNGSSVTYRLVRFEFGSRGFCRKFTDELLQDGFSPTLDLVERYIVPQLQHVINMSNSLRFQQVALVGNACLAQVVKMQQQKGVEPCSFILQEEPGLRSLTPDSPAVKWLSGMCNALIFLSVTLKDLVTLKGESDREKTHCFLPHDPSKAFDNFLQEALRVDQMLCSLTHHCTIITTPVIPLIHQILMKDMARKTFCDKCTKTAKLVTVAIEQVSKMLNQKNGLPVWNLNYALQKNKDVHSSSHQSSSLNSKVVQKAASTWECFLNCSQACIRVMPKVTITSVLQDHKLLSSLLPNAREISRTHCNKKETQSSHSRHRTQTQSNHSRNEQTHNRSSRERKQTHNSSSRNKEHIHNGSSIDRAQTQRSCSIDRKQKSASACSALSNSTSCIFSPVQEEHIIYDVNNHSSKCVSDQYYTYMESSPPSSPDLSSHNNFMYSSHVGPSQTRKEEQNIGSLSLTLTEPQENTEPLNLISSELQKHFITDLTSLSSHERPAVRGIKDNSSSPQELCHAQQVMPSISSCQKESYPHSESMEIEFSSCTHSNSDSCGDQDRSRERNRKSIKENIKPRNQSTRKSGDGSNIKSRGRSFSLKERPYGRNPRIASSAKLCLSPKRKPTYRQSLSRSLSPLWCRYESFSEDKKYISGDRRFTSRDIRSASRSRRSVSRNKRSISTGRRSNSKGRRSISRNRSVSRGRSMSWERSISWDKICIPRRRSSILRGRRSLPRSKRFISKSKRSISRSRLAVLRSERSFSRSRSISRSERSISREKRSSSKSKRSVSKDWRSISRRLIHKSKRSISRSRYISRGKKISSRSRSISRSGTSISRDKRSSSRSRKSTSRDGPYLSGDRMSILRSRKSFSVKRRSIPRGKMSFSKSRKSTSRGRRSLSSNESVSRFIEKRKRSLSSSRSVSKDKTSRRYISRNRRSISRSRRCISKNKRSLSRSRSFSRGRQSISRERIPISRNRRSISRSSRSISRGKKSVLRDRRNRSNILVVHNSVRVVHVRSQKHSHCLLKQE
ncbi:uncharacterized protein LOC135092143 isoform X2 [Scylla paramamosain]|uniref:uncharacterized protein LOC135092143 isoform X2 n=1 Tax=Scylla paramamosain TaxID=85552 RepID=UPI003082E1A4